VLPLLFLLDNYKVFRLVFGLAPLPEVLMQEPVVLPGQAPR
jgi:hypothetical protein